VASAAVVVYRTRRTRTGRTAPQASSSARVSFAWAITRSLRALMVVRSRRHRCARCPRRGGLPKPSSSCFSGGFGRAPRASSFAIAPPVPDPIGGRSW